MRCRLRPDGARRRQTGGLYGEHKRNVWWPGIRSRRLTETWAVRDETAPEPLTGGQETFGPRGGALIFESPYWAV